MDKIDQVLATIAASLSFPTLIQVAINMARCMLNCYYDCTDYSKVYCIAMGEYNVICANAMHPKGDLVLHLLLKLNYFCRVGWESEWIKTARNIIQLEYKCSYKGQYNEVTPLTLIDSDPMMLVCNPYQCVHIQITNLQY